MGAEQPCFYIGIWSEYKQIELNLLLQRDASQTSSYQHRLTQIDCSVCNPSPICVTAVGLSGVMVVGRQAASPQVSYAITLYWKWLLLGHTGMAEP